MAKSLAVVTVRSWSLYFVGANVRNLEFSAPVGLTKCVFFSVLACYSLNQRNRWCF